MKFNGKAVAPGHCEGRAVVTKQPISFVLAYTFKNLFPIYGWLNKGKISDKEHELFEQDLRDRVLFIPVSVGSTLGGYILFEAIKAGITPKAIIAKRADTLLVSGVCLAGVWAETKLLPAVMECPSIFEYVKTGDYVKIDDNSIEIVD